MIRILHSIFRLYDTQTKLHFKVQFEGTPQLLNVYFEGDPQNIALLKPYFHTKKHYKNVANSVLNTEQI